MIGALLILTASTGQLEESCDDPMTQLALNMCAYQDFQRADAAMNAQWQRTVAVTKAADRELARSPDNQPGYFATLLSAQRAWLTYRDQHCTSASFEARGGSMQPMLFSGCKARLTEERTKQLKELTEVEH